MYRCHYCYLAQREECFQGIYPQMKYTPSQVAQALSAKRLGGPCFINICADGETLLLKNIDQYVYALLNEGHYIEIVTNLTITHMVEKILSFKKDMLKRIEFKCSFHYLELKKRGLLDVFAQNVNRILKAGASVTVESVPSDELIKYIDQFKRFSIENFKALPHLTIARDDRTSNINYLTKLPLEEYDEIYSQFDSDFWKYKKSIFGVKQNKYCYAGKWSCYINLATGKASGCYCGPDLGNVFENPNEPFPEKSIGHCPIAHCYNGHAFLTFGLIPGSTDIGYGDIRDRICNDGSHWLQPELKEFFNTKLVDSNKKAPAFEMASYSFRFYYNRIKNFGKRVILFAKNRLNIGR